MLEYSNPLTDATADNVFGQGGSFTSTSAENGGVSANSLNFPLGVAVDGSGDLYIADSDNRVLEYSSPLSSSTANHVFGQGGSFTSTSCNFDTGNLASSSANDLCFSPGGGIAADGAGNLYVADFGNNRTLKYTTPLTTDTTADVVLGQLDFLHNGPNLIDGRGLDNPESVAIDTSTVPNRLYASDSNNSRVLGYKDVTTFVNGGAADLVIGQPDFNSGGCNMGQISPSASSLCVPFGIAVDGSGNLYVADSQNSRVLEYSTPFAGCGSFPCVGGSANLVFGQGGNFTSNDSGLGASGLSGPVGVALDGSGNLYVADMNNSRVLEYDTPLTTDTVADRVFGQGNSFSSGLCNFDTGGGNPTAVDLCAADGVAVDGSGNLYIADTSNSRVLEYNHPLTSTTADLVLGQSNFISKGCNSCRVGYDQPMLP